MDGPSGLCGLRVLRTDKAVFMTAHCLGSRQGVLTAYLDEGKKDVIQNDLQFYCFHTFNAKVKNYCSHTQRFCKYFQKQSETKHRSVKGH